MITPCISTAWSIGGSIKKPYSLLCLTLVALAIRLVAIDHGFPYIYHPDEPTIIRSALGLRFNPNPGHFDWPHLFIYLNFFLYMIFAKARDVLTCLGLSQALSRVVPIVWNDNLVFYLITRGLCAVLGGLSVIPLYLWGKSLFNKASGLLAGAFLALAPFHVRQSHYALIDIPMLFFLLWSLYFSTGNPILCGLFLGLSASTKYNGILGLLFIVIYYTATKRRFADFIKTGIFTLVGFLLGTPFALLDFKTFIRTDGPKGALWQFTNVGHVGLAEQLGQFFTALAVKLPDDLGYGAAAALLAAIAVILYRAVRKKRLERVPALAAALFLVLTFYVSGSEKARSHYYFVVYPYFFLLIGWGIYNIASRIKHPTIRILPIVLLLVPSLVGSVVNIVDLVTKTSDTVYGGDRIKQHEKIP